MKILSLMQPCYLPWLGHFHLWASADEMVWLDDFQYSRSSFHSRNRIGSPGHPDGRQWLTVPVENRLGDTLLAARPGVSSNWRRKHSKSIEMQYRNAPFVDELSSVLEWIREGEFESLAELNLGLLERVGKVLGFQVPIRRSSQMKLSAHGRSERVVEILEACGADRYLVARGSVEYMREDTLWTRSPVELWIQNFQCPAYEQPRSPTFVSHLSVVDAIACLGGRATRRLVASRSADWMSFEEAKSGECDKNETIVSSQKLRRTLPITEPAG